MAKPGLLSSDHLKCCSGFFARSCSIYHQPRQQITLATTQITYSASVGLGQAALLHDMRTTPIQEGEDPNPHMAKNRSAYAQINGGGEILSDKMLHCLSHLQRSNRLCGLGSQLSRLQLLVLYKRNGLGGKKVEPLCSLDTMLQIDFNLATTNRNNEDPIRTPIATITSVFVTPHLIVKV